VTSEQSGHMTSAGESYNSIQTAAEDGFYLGSRITAQCEFAFHCIGYKYPYLLNYLFIYLHLVRDCSAQT